MTTSDTLGAPPRQRLLRRSRDGRVAAGVAGGLGEYFALDPVLFRVLFATSAFFGGAGILAYLIAWAAIPEAGTAHAHIDGWMAELRRRKVPVWVVACVGGILLWAIAFSWWAPGPFVPVVVVGVIIVAFLSRRATPGAAQRAPSAPPGPPHAAQAPVSLTKDDAAGRADDGPATTAPTWVNDVRSWVGEAREASRARARRALPVKLATLVTLVAALTTLGVVDAVSGLPLQYYFWATLGIVALGLLVGVLLRRTPLAIASLLLPAAVGAAAFAGSHASLHDGIGQRDWTPSRTAVAHYRLAFGQADLDLRRLTPAQTPTRIDITVGAGQVRIIAPTSLNMTVHANIHIGQLDVDGSHVGHGHSHFGHGHGGVGLRRVVEPPVGATGAPLTVDVHLADGQVTIEHR